MIYICIHSFQSRLLPPAPGWVRTSTSRSCTGRSRAMWCATCSASGAGSIASSPRWFENATFSCYLFAMRICCPAVLTAFSVSAEWVEMMTNRTVHWAQNIKYHWNGFHCVLSLILESFRCTVLQGQPGPTRPAGWGTRPSKAMSSTVSRWGGEDVNAPLPRDAPMVGCPTFFYGSTLDCAHFKWFVLSWW